jgi:predicted outer membrane protein
MTSITKLAALVATGSLLFAGASVPALAASAATEAFVANVRPNVDFLDRSSRMALDSSKSARVKAFAHSEAIDQTVTANSLVAWSQTHTASGEAIALGTVPADGPLAPLADLATAPLGVASTVTTGVTNGVGDVLTGRSVAIDNPLAPLTVTRTPDPSSAQLLPSDRDDLSRLSGLSGRRFDALYRSTQSDSLHQLATLYRDYIQSGDDPGLRAIAVRELPKVQRRLTELHTL